MDSELTLLYFDMHGRPHPVPAGIPNPFFGKLNAPFRHPDFPIYLVTRLAGFDFEDVKGIIDRALVARNRGKFVIDLKGSDNTKAMRWLLQAAQQLPRDRVVLDRFAHRAPTRIRCDRLRVVGFERSGPQGTPPRFPLAAGRHHDRIRIHQRTHLRAPARQLEHWRWAIQAASPDLRKP